MAPNQKSHSSGGVAGLLASLSDTHIRIGIAAAAGLLFFLIFELRFCAEITLEPPPNPPKVSSQVVPHQVAATVEASASGYASFLEGDSRAHAISPPMTPEKMAEKFPYNVDENRHHLVPGRDATLETAGLRLTASVRGEGPGSALVLRIDNLTEHPLAYHVVTRPDQATRVCNHKRELRHNAIAIPAGDFVIRSECTNKRGKGLQILKVETMVLPELSFFYVSALQPSSLGLDPRSTDGHTPPGGEELCNRPLSAALESALQSGETTWRDMIDFYARHPCKTYKFPSDYKAFKKSGERQLPVVGAN